MPTRHSFSSMVELIPFDNVWTSSPECYIIVLLSKAGTFTETRPDGTVVTYEMEVEEFEEEVSLINKSI